MLTDAPAGGQPGIYYNIPAGGVLMVTQYRGALTTLSDTLLFELGYTDAANGGGNFTPVTCQYNVKTGAANSGIEPPYFVIDPPLRIAYSMGARSVTFRAQTNDAGATADFAWHGWTESE